MKEYDERFRAMLEMELEKIGRKAEDTVICKAHGGFRPKKKVVERFVMTEQFAELKRECEENLGANEIREALESDEMLEKLAMSGKYDENYKDYCRKHETEEERKEREAWEQKRDDAEIELSEYLEENDIEDAIDRVADIVMDEYHEEILQKLSAMKPVYSARSFPYARFGNYTTVYKEDASVNEENYEEFLEDLFGYDDIRCLSIDYIESMLDHNIVEEMSDLLIENDPYLSELSEDYPDLVYEKVSYYVEDSERSLYMMDDLQSYFDEDTVLECLRQNPDFKKIFQKLEQAKQDKVVIEQAIIDKIPENVIDLYPNARKLKRKFTLHIGPTNSGKTFSAMEALREAGSGIYLAPLRLLAFEQYEKLNADGYPCNMVTGEERKEVEGAVFTASTIEVANFEKVYRHVVIDEAQMITDPSRGGAWTSAILGICSENISVCLSPDAEGLIVRLVNMCGDEYEIVRHNRKVPLTVESNGFNFPKSVKDGDALIVFSKKNVHAVAAELQEKNISCSIIYGALPYDVRHEEARKFACGETKILVATDAIGMGLNLPIKRVVFLEVAKFDGTCKRVLKPAEIKQIAGRAGRYGKYDEGLVSSSLERKMIRSGLQSNDKPLEKAILAFPEALIGIKDSLSGIMEKWINLEAKEGFAKSDLSEKLPLCKFAEQRIRDKRLIYSLITLPFDMNNEEVLSLWQRMVIAKAKDKEIDFADVYKPLPKEDLTAGDLMYLENAHKICDLIYAFCDRFGYNDEIERAMAEKEAISKMIMRILKQQKLVGRTCKYCGRKLSWNYPYGMCGKCHDLRFPPRYGYYDDDDDYLW